MVTLKFGHGHINLITSFRCPNNVSLAVWSKSMHWFTRYTAGKAHFYSLNSLKNWVKVTNSDQIDIYSNDTIYEAWSESILFKG